MTQQQILDALDNLMPEVVSTKNPETTLLKFAKTNNLYPTQLEKLGHAFNQCKTLVGLSKQANRGDSFSILNVPEMVSKYSTYTPAEVLTKKDKAIHKKVDKLTKAANTNVVDGGRLPMPDFTEKLIAKGAEVLENDVREYDFIPKGSAFDVTFNKKASVAEQGSDLSLYEQYELKKKAAQELEDLQKEANTIKAGLEEVIRVKCSDIANYLRKEGSQAWGEIVEDVALRFGEKSAAAINTIENYLEVKHIPFTPVNITEDILNKYAFSQDRHGVFDTITDINDSLNMMEKLALNIDDMLPEVHPFGVDPDFDRHRNDSLATIIKGLDFKVINADGEEVSPNTTKAQRNLVNSIQKIQQENQRRKMQGLPLIAPNVHPHDANIFTDHEIIMPQSEVAPYIYNLWKEYEADRDARAVQKEEEDKIKEQEQQDKEEQRALGDINKNFDDAADQVGKTVMKAYKAGLVDVPLGAIKGTFGVFKNAPATIERSNRVIRRVLDELPIDDKYDINFKKKEIELNKDLNLHKLILTDPVIAEADPQEVSEIYNTIAEISPRFAQNTRLMSTALKEALQFGAVPLNMLKDISEFEKNMNKDRR